MITFLLCLIATTIYPSSTYELLDSIPVTFEIGGDTTYTPSSGGISIFGYKLKVGYDKHSWIGVKFMEQTSENTYDIIVVQRSNSPIGGYYETTVGEYFVSKGRQDKLLSDSTNNMDKQTITYTNSNYFQVQISRTKGNTNGEDWEGGNFIKICFLTSSSDFDQQVWTGLTESCYGYDVTDDYHSTFRGRQISNSTKVDGKSAYLFGGVEGPFLEMMLFWYVQDSPLSSNDIIIKFNEEVSEQVGKDYYSCTDGDKFGTNTDELIEDIDYSGFDDGSCTVQTGGSYVKIAYSRHVYTYDEFDIEIYESNKICIIVGSSETCNNIKLQTLYPVMDVESAIVIFESFYLFSTATILLLSLLI